MTNVRKIHVDWYGQQPPRFHGGPQLAYQGDHLSNMVVFDHAPELPNYYLLVEMKTDEAGPVVTLPEILLEGAYWVIPNYYTQICQKITYQVCCKTGTGDFEHHSAKFEGTILPVIKHDGEPIDQSPMFDPYIDILDKRVSELILDAGVKEIDSELKSDSTNPVQNKVVKAAIDEIGDMSASLQRKFDGYSAQGVLENIFKFGSGFPTGKVITQKGVTLEVLNDHTIKLNGTATEGFNTNFAFHSIPLTESLWLYMMTDAENVDGYLQTGYFDSDSVIHQTTKAIQYNGFEKINFEQSAVDSRFYYHINTGAVFNDTVICFLAFENLPKTQKIDRAISGLIDNINGKYTFAPFGTFSNYSFTNGSQSIYGRYRVSNTDPMHFDKDIVVTAANGFKWGFYPYTDGVCGTFSGWNTAAKIDADTEFVIIIARVSENGSEIADTNEFLSAVTFVVDTDDESSDTSDYNVLREQSDDIQGLKTNRFALSAAWPKDYVYSVNGVVATVLDSQTVRLSGTSSAAFNINYAFRSFNVSDTMYYYVDCDDEAIDETMCWIQTGYFDGDGTSTQGKKVPVLRDFYKIERAEAAVTGRDYLHIESGVTFNDTVIRVFAFDGMPIKALIDTLVDSDTTLKATDFFNAEPYSGTYDWQTPVVEYGALFGGKSHVESFAFFTDPHLLGYGDDNRNETRMENSLKRVQKTYNSSPCSFMVCGGDWLNNGTTKAEACYRLGYLKGISKNMFKDLYLVNGNHDTNYQGRADSDSELHTGRLTNETIASIMYRDTETKKAYYSFDGANSKCYVLDSGIEHSSMLEYDWEQIAWLANKLKTDDAEHAIIFLHIIMSGTAVQTNATNFGSLVAAYNSHSTVTLNSISYDFTECTGHVDFWVAGHTHVDSTGTLGGIPYIITASNAYNSDVPIIDLFLVDYENRMVYTVRAGNIGNNRSFSI